MKPTREQLVGRYGLGVLSREEAERRETVATGVIGLAQILVDNAPDCDERRRALEALDLVQALATMAIERHA